MRGQKPAILPRDPSGPPVTVMDKARASKPTQHTQHSNPTKFVRHDLKRPRPSGARRGGHGSFPRQPPVPRQPSAERLTGREIALRIRRKTGAVNSSLSGFFGGEEADETPRASLIEAREKRKPIQCLTRADAASDPTGAPGSDPLEAYMTNINQELHAPQLSTSKGYTALLSDDENRPDQAAEPGRLLSEDEGEDYQAQDSDDEGWLSRSRRKRLAYEKVDHSKINYLPFKKDFYIEAPELGRMSKEDVAEYRASLGGVRIRGQDCPKPIRSWGQCGLQTAVLEVLKRLQFESPTGIQAQAIPCIMSGRDVIGVARTGSGKTLAFVLPMLRHIAAQPKLLTGEGPIGLVIAPTRELAIQIYNDARKFAKVLQMRCVCAYGGSGIGEQISEIKRGAEMVVCTPGRMIDLLAMNSGRVTNLRRCTMVVLDEADRMFDMGFEPQVTRIVENIRRDKQAVMFSATFPQQVENLARKILKRPVEIAVGGHSVAAATIEQHIEVRSEKSKFLRLLELLGVWHDQGAVLIFVDRQDSADRLFQELVRAAYKKTLVLHGGMDQADRDSAISDFKNGVAKVLVATSVAARGLDVKGLRLVVNYDTPNHYEDYVHRVGRTGRAGSKGTAYTFITPEQEMYAPDLAKALQQSAKAVYESLNPGTKKGDPGLEDAMNAALPEDLKALVSEFQKKRSLGLVKFKPGSGFGGKGFKFDQEEETAHQALQRTRGDDRRPDEREKDRKKDSTEDFDDDDVIVREIVSGKSTAELKMGETQPPRSAPSPRTETTPAERLAAAVAQVVKEGKQHGWNDDVIKARIAKTKATILMSEASRPKIPAVPHSATTGSNVPISGAKIEAIALANEISRRLGGVPDTGGSGTLHVDPEPEVVKKFATELEINDYPQHARWKVTHKGSLTDVEEDTATAVTTKGNFYAPGRNPLEGERKLFLLIEGPDERSVRAARREVKQRLEDAAIARPEDKGAYGKYSVM